MKIQVLHDSVGKICSIFAPIAGRGRRGGIESPTADMTVIEVDAPEVTLPTQVDQHDRVAATLSNLMQHYEVRGGRLVERSGNNGK